MSISKCSLSIWMSWECAHLSGTELCFLIEKCITIPHYTLKQIQLVPDQIKKLMGFCAVSMLNHFGLLFRNMLLRWPWSQTSNFSPSQTKQIMLISDFFLICVSWKASLVPFPAFMMLSKTLKDKMFPEFGLLIFSVLNLTSRLQI